MLKTSQMLEIHHEFSLYRYHDCETVHRLRQFFNAVLQYTKATRLHIISHSMGVTLARKIVQGGRIKQPNGGILIFLNRKGMKEF